MSYLPAMQVVLIIFMEGSIPEEMLCISSSYKQSQAEKAIVFIE
jgi:hypothetical protein